MTFTADAPDAAWSEYEREWDQPADDWTAFENQEREANALLAWRGNQAYQSPTVMPGEVNPLDIRRGLRQFTDAGGRIPFPWSWRDTFDPPRPIRPSFPSAPPPRDAAALFRDATLEFRRVAQWMWWMQASVNNIGFGMGSQFVTINGVNVEIPRGWVPPFQPPPTDNPPSPSTRAPWDPPPSAIPAAAKPAAPPVPPGTDGADGTAAAGRAYLMRKAS